MAGERYTILSCLDRSAYITGTNDGSVFGDGTSEPKIDIVRLPDVVHGSEIVTGRTCLFALTDSGAVYAWGTMITGSLTWNILGLPMDNKSLWIPFRVPNIPPIRQVAIGYLNAMYLTEDSLVLVSGENYFGGLGNGSIFNIDDTNDHRDTGAFYANISSVVQVAAGLASCFALTSNGELYGWGGNQFLRSIDTSKYFTTPTKIPLPSPARLIRVGYNPEEWSNLFVLDTGGVLYGQGENEQGQLGLTKHWVRELTKLGQWSQRCKAVEVGLEHTLVLLEDGTVWAAGSNRRGQLGQSDLLSHEGFVQVPNLGQVTDVAAGGNVSFARGVNGTWYAWGDNRYGQLDLSTTIPYLSRPFVLPTPCVLATVAESRTPPSTKVFPLPTEDVVTLTYPAEMAGNKQVVVFSQQGIEVLHTSTDASDVVLHVDILAPGVYAVITTSDKGSVARCQIVVR